MLLRLTLLLLVCPLAIAAGESPQVRAARYYAQGLEAALLPLRAGAQLIQACKDRLKRACDAQQRKQAEQANLLQLLDALTLFPQRLSQDPATGIHGAREFRRAVAATSDALLAEASLYDRHLFARFGATLMVCPRENSTQFRESVDALERLNYSRFQSLEDDAVADQIRTTRVEEAAAAESLRKQPPEDCVAARTLGEYLMELVNSKLQPWSGPDPQVANQEPKFDFDQPRKKEPEPKVRDRDLAHSVAGNFVSVVATELQLEAHPESETLIKSITDASAADRPSERK